MAGRFARRVRASAAAHGIPVIDCKRGERKPQIAEEYLATLWVPRTLSRHVDVTYSCRGRQAGLVEGATSSAAAGARRPPALYVGPAAILSICAQLP